MRKPDSEFPILPDAVLPTNLSPTNLSAVALEAMRSLVAWALCLRARWSGARVGLMLCYHRIAEREGDPTREISAAVSVREFERHLRHLRHRYRVVPPSHLPTAVATPARGRRLPVAISFDDDLPSQSRTPRRH